MQRQAATFGSADAFVDALREGDREAWDVFLHREGGTQFRTTTAWVNGNPSKRHVVCYSSRLAEDISRAVNVAIGDPGSSKAVGIANTTTTRLEKCDIKAKERNVSTRHSEGLNAVNTKWVEWRYRGDLELFERYCS
jgi:hypothetical protein